MIIIKAILTIAVSASAGVTVQPKDKAYSVYGEILKSAQYASIFCFNDSDECKIEWAPRGTKPVPFTDYAMQRKAWMSELSVLEDKINDGSASDFEVKRAVYLMMKIKGMSKT